MGGQLTDPCETPIIVVGMGFVGLACFTGFKKLGYRVFGYEINTEKVNNIRQLKGNFLEPEVRAYLEECGNLSQAVFYDLNFGKNFENVCAIICVGTPGLPEGQADLNFVRDAIKTLLEELPNTKIELIIKSTVPPGTINHNLRPYLKTLDGNSRASLISNPEFLREGFALSDFLNPDRIILGIDDSDETQIGKIYSNHFDCVLFTNSVSAELSKYHSNGALASMISYSNEIRLLADSLGGVDQKTVFAQFQMDRRWLTNEMSSYFWPGLGFGGYCLPKDTDALRVQIKQNKVSTSLLDAVCGVNDYLIRYFTQKIQERTSHNTRLVFLGVSFKVGSNDMRESRTVELLNSIIDASSLECCVLDEPAASELAVTHQNVKILQPDELQPTDLLIVALRRAEFKEIIERVPAKQVLNIPLLH